MAATQCSGHTGRMPADYRHSTPSVPATPALSATPPARRSVHSRPGHQVLLVGYPQCMSLDITGTMQVFATANDVRMQQGLAAFYHLELVAAQAGPLAFSCGLQVLATRAWADWPVQHNATVLVPGGDGVEQVQHDSALRQWLQAIEPQVQRLGSVCSGALVLAHAGLLHGHTATTHWCRTAQLRAIDPAIHVDADCLHTFAADDAQRRHVFTSAGVTAGIDLALALVEADLGSAMALAVARQLVLFVRRSGGQAQFSPLLAPEITQAPRLAKLLDWIPSHIDRALPIEALAAQACLPPRTLARVFQRELGTTPARYVEQVRLQTAATLLGQRKASVATVARLCGFGHPESLRRGFHKHWGISPSAFAERFGAG